MIFYKAECADYVPILTNTVFHKHLKLNQGDKFTYTPTVANPDDCIIYFELLTTTSYKSFSSSTGVVTIDTDEADGAASNSYYEFQVTVVAPSNPTNDDPDSTKTFTIDFCPDYNPTIVLTMDTVTFTRNSGTKQTIAPAFTPSNDASCTMHFEKFGADSNNALITGFSSTTGVFTVDTNTSADK